MVEVPAAVDPGRQAGRGRAAHLLAALSLLATSGHAQDAGAATEGAPRDLSEVPELAGLVERWSGALTDLRVPGCAVAVVRGDSVLGYAGLGVRNPDGEPVDADTMFYIASITKTFTAGAAAALAERDALDLDEVVEEYLPRFTLADEEAAWSLTVRELLCHAPGLNRFPIVFLDAYTGEITEDRYYHWLAQVEPLGETSYSNVHFTLAGRVLEARTGKPWQEVLDEVLFQPAGMTRTTAYASRLYGDANAALPMEWAEGGYRECATRKVDSTMHAAGGTGTCARDAARWVLLNLNGGALGERRVFSAETAADMLTEHSRMPPRGQIRRSTGFGLGWSLGTYRGRPYASHGGGYVGTAAHVSFLPDDGLGVVVLTNSAPGGQALCDVVSIDVYDRLLGLEEPDLLPSYVRRMQAERADPAEPVNDLVTSGALSLDPPSYVGRFEDRHWGTLRLTLSEGELQGRIGAMRVHLRAAGAEQDTFVLDSDAVSGVSGRFVAEGGVVVAVELAGEGLEARFVR